MWTMRNAPTKKGSVVWQHDNDRIRRPIGIDINLINRWKLNKIRWPVTIFEQKKKQTLELCARTPNIQLFCLFGIISDMSHECYRFPLCARCAVEVRKKSIFNFYCVKLSWLSNVVAVVAHALTIYRQCFAFFFYIPPRYKRRTLTRVVVCDVISE